jgi:peptidyl-prolyl cis-trans isomerase D
MAIIETIRNRAGTLIAIIIGLSLLAFIMGDFLESGRFLISGSKNEIAKISGKSITYQDYQQKVDEFTEIYKNNTSQSSPDEAATENIREQAWRQIIQDNVIKEEINKLGITVSSDELSDMIQGTNPHPIIKQLFTNAQTGQLNKTQLFQFLKAMVEGQVDEKQKAYWLYIEKQIENERMLTKYSTLISKGLNVTNYQVQEEGKNMAHKVNFSYIVRRFNEVSDSAVKITPSDLKSYYKEHLKEFKQEASRSFEYISFDVKPSEDDFKNAETWINSIVDDFKNASDVKPFVNANSDQPFDEKNYKLGELPDSLNDFMFKAKVGDIYGPYFKDNSFKLYRLAEINNLPDSVKARHILIRPQGQDEAAMNKAKSFADSLKTLVKNGKDFAELAKANSIDGSANKGGDLGWFKDGAMVKPFNDACFNGKKGDLVVVESQFGVHLIQIMDKGKEMKKVKVATVVRKVQPSEKTRQIVYGKASQFAGLNNTAAKFDKAVADQGIIVKYAQDLRPTENRITGLESPRDLIRWSFDAKLSEISKPFELGDRFVIAKLTKAAEEGIASLETVTAQLDLDVRKEKKSQKLAEEIKNSQAKSLEDLAIKFNTQMNIASGVSFSASSIASVGFEPKLIATATSLEVNKISDPIEGINGVYVIKVTSVADEPASKELLSINKNRLNSTYQMRANYESMQALEDIAKIKDRRSKFF